jgi:Flp pilus assembly pilin Flp
VPPESSEERSTMWYRVRCLFSDEEGAATVEYALLLALVVVASIGAFEALGNGLRQVLETALDSMADPVE